MGRERVPQFQALPINTIAESTDPFPRRCEGIDLADLLWWTVGNVGEKVARVDAHVLEGGLMLVWERTEGETAFKVDAVG